jgi:hypothetical protein
MKQEMSARTDRVFQSRSREIRSDVAFLSTWPAERRLSGGSTAEAAHCDFRTGARPYANTIELSAGSANASNVKQCLLPWRNKTTPSGNEY